MRGVFSFLYIFVMATVLYSADGDLKWSYTSGDSYYWPMTASIADDGTIYAGSSDDNLTAINPDGTKKWEFVTEDWIGSNPAIADDGTIYIGSRDYKFYAISGSSGGLADTPWPKFQFNSKNTGKKSSKLPLPALLYLLL